MPYLERATYILADGTFKVAPTPFSQLYTVHAKIGDSYPPLLYIFMANKTEESYNIMWSQVKALGNNVIAPVAIMDMEIASWNALLNVSPTTRIQTCYFHLTQAWKRHMEKHGAAKRVREDPDFQKCLHMALGLSSVPAGDVVAVFNELLASNEWVDDQDTIRLASYIRRNYVEGYTNAQGNHVAPRFPPDMWVVRESMIQGGPRTNNGCEGWHNAINRRVTLTNPTFGYVIQKLEEDMNSVAQTINEILLGNGKPQTHKSKRNAAALKRLAQNYNAQGDRIDYLLKFSIRARGLQNYNQ